MGKSSFPNGWVSSHKGPIGPIANSAHRVSFPRSTYRYVRRLKSFDDSINVARLVIGVSK